MLTMGMDLGSRNIKTVVYDTERRVVVYASVTDVSPDSANDALRARDAAIAAIGVKATDFCEVIATGYGRAMAEFATNRITEITCHAAGVFAIFPEVKTIIDIGGQDSKAIRIANGGSVADFAMNDRCAAGTGRFLEVAAKILHADVSDLSEVSSTAKDRPEISSMCVVFAESEILGMLSKGYRAPEISLGLHAALARRVVGLAQRCGIESPIAFTGGVALNLAMVRAIGAELRERLLVPPDPRVTGALGAALLAARRQGQPGTLADINFKVIDRQSKAKAAEAALQSSIDKQHAASSQAKANGCAEFDAAGESCASSCSGVAEELPCKPTDCGTKSQAPTSCSGGQGSVSSCVTSDCGATQSACSGETEQKRRTGAEFQAQTKSVARFDRMIANCVDYVKDAKRQGKKIVSIFCEYTPRELILAADAVPVCMCGGSNRTSQLAEAELPANLCPLIKSSYGYMMDKSSPLFEMSDCFVAETTCDGKKKMYELLGLHKPAHVLELTQKPDANVAYLHWRDELVSLKEKLELWTGNKITDDKLRAAIKAMNEERALRLEIAGRAGKGLTGSDVLKCKSSVPLIKEDMDAYRDILTQPIKAENGARPRILLTGVPMPYGAEKVLNLLEECGATVVVQENCTGIKPLYEPVSEEGDPMEAIAQKYFHLPCSCMMPNVGRFDLIDSLIPEYGAQGVLDLVWQACHTYNVEAVALKKHIETRHGLPYLKVETDYSPSDIEQIRLRIEAFLSIVVETAQVRRSLLSAAK